jgi:hypothetical protein
VDGTNTSFTLSSSPTSPSATLLFVAGIFQTWGVDYTVSGNAITFAVAPRLGSTLYSIYS